MASLPAQSGAGGPRIPAPRAGRPAALRLLLLLGAILKPQDSVAQLLTTPGSLGSEDRDSSSWMEVPGPEDLEGDVGCGHRAASVPTGKTMKDCYERCWRDYKELMDTVKQDWCNWTIISRPYSFLQNCLEGSADQFGLGFPNPMAEHIIFEAHLTHFANCSLVQPTFSDPPEDVLLAMIIAPICLIPFLVTLVVWRSKDSEAHT